MVNTRGGASPMACAWSFWSFIWGGWRSIYRFPKSIHGFSRSMYRFSAAFMEVFELEKDPWRWKIGFDHFNLDV